MKKPHSSVLVVEDDHDQMLIVSGFLSRIGLSLRCAPDAEQAMKLLEEETPDLILSDINLPGMSGIDLLSKVRPRCPEITVVMMTAFSSIDQAVACIKLGADDYVTKPLHLLDLQGRIERALAHRATRTRLQQLESHVRERHRFDRIIGQSAAMQRVFHIIERAAPS